MGNDPYAGLGAEASDFGHLAGGLGPHNQLRPTMKLPALLQQVGPHLMRIGYPTTRPDDALNALEGLQRHFRYGLRV